MASSPGDGGTLRRARASRTAVSVGRSKISMIGQTRRSFGHASAARPGYAGRPDHGGSVSIALGSGQGSPDTAALEYSGPVVLPFARAGFGVGVCQAVVAASDPELTRVLPKAFAPELETWIVMHEDMRTNGPCRGVFDALAADLAALCVRARSS